MCGCICPWGRGRYPIQQLLCASADTKVKMYTTLPGKGGKQSIKRALNQAPASWKALMQEYRVLWESYPLCKHSQCMFLFPPDLACCPWAKRQQHLRCDCKESVLSCFCECSEKCLLAVIIHYMHHKFLGIKPPQLSDGIHLSLTKMLFWQCTNSCKTVHCPIWQHTLESGAHYGWLWEKNLKAVERAEWSL